MANGYCIDWKKLEVNQENRGTPVNPIVAMMFSLAMGGAFVLFLPFIGLYMFAGFLLSKAGVALGSLFETAIVPQAAVGTAHLTGAPAAKDPGPTSALQELSEEIERKRKVQ